MNLNGLFGWLDYFIYLVQSTNHHGVHSPFVYDFADNVLYRQLANSYEPAAENYAENGCCNPTLNYYWIAN